MALHEALQRSVQYWVASLPTKREDEQYETGEKRNQEDLVKGEPSANAMLCQPWEAAQQRCHVVNGQWFQQATVVLGGRVGSIQLIGGQ